MKPRYQFKKTLLENHVELPFWKNLGHIAGEHEYKGFISIIWFYLIILKDYLLHLVSRVTPFSSFVVAFHRLRGVQIGEGVHISPGVIIDDVYPCMVSIGNRVSLAGNNFILTHSKPMEFHSRVSESYRAPVVIEDDVWVAIGVIILPGVRIGRGSIIASGSVVTKSIPPFVLAAGAPAKIKKDISDLVKHNFSDEEFKIIMDERLSTYGF